jgi:hypothetical protein
MADNGIDVKLGSGVGAAQAHFRASNAVGQKKSAA